MKKALVIIIAVALLGVVATYAAPASKKPKAVASLAPAASNSLSAGSSNTITPQSSAAANAPSSQTTANGTSAAAYKDGTYQGDDYNNPYGDVQVSVNISGGKITAVNFDKLTAEDQHSEEINNYASGNLKQQTLNAQSAQIDGVSGATFTSNSYIQSLQSALDKAKV